MLDFVKCVFFNLLRWSFGFFSPLFSLCSVLHWFSYVEPPSHSWNKFHLTMYNPFNIVLDSVWQYFVEDFLCFIHKEYWYVVFFSCDVFVWPWYQGNTGLKEWTRKCPLLFDKSVCEELVLILLQIFHPWQNSPIKPTGEESVLLKNNWRTSLYKFKGYSMVVWFTYILKWLSQ